MKRIVAVGLLALCLLGGLGVGLVGAEPAHGFDAVDPVAGDSIGADTQPSAFVTASVASETGINVTGEDNETIRHRHPDDLDPATADLEGWLLDRLGMRIETGASQLSERQYAAAREVLGENYTADVEGFVTVNGTDVALEALLIDTGSLQLELADLVEASNATRAQYEDALAAEDEERVRELAHELIAIADDIEGVTVDLEANLVAIDEDLGIETETARTAFRELDAAERAWIEEHVVGETLIETNLSVWTDQSSISFVDPLVATGQLQTVEGDPIGNESITLTVAGEPRQVRTDANGTFTVEYRPVDIGVNESIPVAYVPAPDSPYLGSEATIDVPIDQVTPELTVDPVAESVAFGEYIEVSATLSVGDLPVSGVRLNVSLGDVALGSLAVSEGAGADHLRVPADIPTGEQDLAVSLPGGDRALAGVSATHTVTVRETETTLSAAVSSVETGGATTALAVDGHLETVDALAVPDAPVDVAIDGTDVATVRTDADGEFEDTLDLPEDVESLVDAGGETLTVTLSYAGAPNLGPSETTEAVTVTLEEDTPGAPGANGAGGEGPVGTLETLVSENPGLVAGLVGLAVAALLAGGFLALYRRRAANADEEAPSEGPGEESVPSGAGPTTAMMDELDVAPGSTETLFDRASEYVAAGRPDRAVQVCYAAVRGELEETLAVARALTHWEFYRTYVEAGDGAGTQSEGATEPERGGETDEAEALRDLTADFEHATYSGEETTPEAARGALESARRVVGEDADVSLDDD